MTVLFFHNLLIAHRHFSVKPIGRENKKVKEC